LKNSIQKTKKIHIAVFLTSYNRKAKTLGCLKALYSQTEIDNIVMAVYLMDDRSTDGTADAVRSNYPDVNLLQGNGQLYWGGGMRLAWTEAMKSDYDYYLWLNDDTILLENALHVLLKTSQQTHKQEGKEGIIVGSCRDPETGEHTYGGSIRKKFNAPVTPTDYAQNCDLMNGNIVLIPRGVSKVVGNISPEFTHCGGDNDYGLRTIKAGFKLWVAPGYQGLCAANNYNPWADPKVPLRERWRYLHSPKGQPPYEIYVYARRHSGFFWPMDIVKLYLRVLFPGTWKKLKKIPCQWTKTKA
jgi:GT2 family glycosyltransferase